MYALYSRYTFIVHDTAVMGTFLFLFLFLQANVRTHSLKRYIIYPEAAGGVREEEEEE
jgi:hypothetical protein